MLRNGLTDEMAEPRELASGGDLPGPRSAFLRHVSSDWSRVFDRLRAALADGSLFFGIAAVAIWILSRPFKGIQGDARIYMTRALADLDPNGVGRDMMFVHDGQSQFSIFTPLSGWLVAALNPQNTAIVLAIADTAAWIGSAAFLIGRLKQGRAVWAILTIVAVIPSFYGPLNFHFGEIIAVPRPLAEACVLAALGLMLNERRIAAFCFLLLAAAFHPIMALPGLAVFALDLCRTRRIWIAVFAAGAVTGLAAVYMGLPLFNRLNVVIDPEWLALLRTRNWNLFPTEWPLESFGFVTLQVATISVGAGLFAPRLRFIFWSSAALGVIGILVTAVFGDLLPILLIAQAQVWRMAWLTSVMAAIALGACLLEVRTASQRASFSYAFLSLGWLMFDQPVILFFVSFIAVVLNRARNVTFAFNRNLLKATWAIILFIGIVDKVPATAAFFNFWRTAPADAHTPFVVLWSIFTLSIFLAMAVILLAGWDHRLRPKALGFFAFVSSLAAICIWDDRQPSQKITDAAHHEAGLTSLFPSGNGEIYSPDNFEPWYLLGRPAWASPVQGAAAVFARPLATGWHERVRALIGLDLIDDNILTAGANTPSPKAIIPARSSIDALCSRSDAPSAIVLPLEEGMAIPADLKFKTWKPAAPEYRLSQEDAVVTWHRIEKFMIVSCADHVPEQQASRQ